MVDPRNSKTTSAQISLIDKLIRKPNWTPKSCRFDLLKIGLPQISYAFPEGGRANHLHVRFGSKADRPYVNAVSPLHPTQRTNAEASPRARSRISPGSNGRAPKQEHNIILYVCAARLRGVPFEG